MWNDRKRQLYSQGEEEKWIIDHFASMEGNDSGRFPPGNFLDIGAYDGVTFSNTAKLVKLGWSGTMVEPSAYVIRKLIETYEDNDTVDIINAAITAHYDGPIKFYESRGDMVGTTVKAHRDMWSDAVEKFIEYTVMAMSVRSLFSCLPVDWELDFINLDIEGANFEVFNQFPFNTLKSLQAMCIEFDGKTEVKKQMIDVGKRIGFVMKHENAENLFFVRM